MTANEQAAQAGGAAPRRHLSVVDAVCVVVGVVVATAIFRSPRDVANCVGDPAMILALWALGGLLCLCGSLTYAELSASCPGVGGEYLYLTRSFGGAVGFLFVWARMTVIQTGSIAAMVFVFGDYSARLLGWQPWSAGYLALGAVAVLTLCNALGLRAGKWTQNALTVAKIVGILAIAALGLTLGKVEIAASAATAEGSGGLQAGALGLAMVFVLYTYGGWNESAYVAGELRGRGRSMLWVLVSASVLLTLLYVGVNAAYLHVLGVEGMQSSNAVAAATMGQLLGKPGALAVSVLVAVAALGAADACIFTGARAIYAWGNDYPAFGVVGRWNARLARTIVALTLQGVIAVLLVGLPVLIPALGEKVGNGFETAVQFTAPVFWAFLLLTGVALFVLRVRNPHAPRPLGRWLPLVTGVVLCIAAAFMLYSSLAYTKAGALVGVGVLLVGVPVYFIAGATSPR